MPTPPEPTDRYPLAPLQRGMLFHALAAPDSPAYVEQLRYRLSGELDLPGFRAAWQAVCAAHPALRTGFDWRQADRPEQVVQPAVALPLVAEDWRDRPAGAHPQRLARLAAAERDRGFDLAQPPLFRLRLVRLADRDWQLLWTYHHLILDGWSAGVVRHDAGTGYRAARWGAPVTVPPAPPYRDFVAWVAGQDLAPAEQHWAGLLAGFTEPTPLGIARTTSAGGGAARRVSRRLPAELASRLDRFAADRDLTVETVLAAAWAVVLGRYAGRDDVVFGVTATGRSAPLPGLDRTAGLLINTLPARVRLDPDQPVAGWLAELHRRQERARELAHTPLDRVQAASQLPAGRRLFDSILVVEDFPHHPASGQWLGEPRVTESEAGQQTDYPLTLLAYPGQRRELAALVDPGAVDPPLAEQLLGHLATALDRLTTARALSDVEILSPAERTELRTRGAPRGSFPVTGTDLAPARFAQHARQQPEQLAVSCGNDQLSYRELAARVARLAHRLHALGVRPGSLVGICLPRGVELVVAVLAVSCAGAGYLPVDRRDPAARVRTVLADASATVLLTDREAAAGLGGVPPTVVCLDDPAEQQRLAGQPAGLPPLAAAPHDPAYVIYTSGSTGTPKGVVVEHAQLARLFGATHQWFGFGPDDAWTLFHSIAFDFSVWELWGALAHGGRLVVVPEPLTRDPAGFRELLLAEGVTVLNQTPSAFQALLHADLGQEPAAGYRLRWVVLGGEQLDVASLQPWLARYGDQQPRLVNMYGITETTVHVTYRPVKMSDLDTGVPSPIGEPIPDLAVRLLDPHGRPVPAGVPGEIQVGGAGVARGYLHRPELTAQRFLAGGSGRWYRTGDRARWLPAGGLEFLGRLDDQVKIRGHRIELGEIEAVLHRHPLVRQAVVTARRTGPDQHRQLVAYVVPEPGEPDLTWSALRAWLAEQVPEHLVPAGLVRLDRLPLTPNGKVDRAALPAPDPAARPDSGAPVPPGTEVERVLADVWAEVLGVAQVGTTDNFFELGGDSILTIQVVARANRRGVSVTPAQLFAHQTVAALAQVAVPAGEQAAAEQGEVTGEVSATPAQAWFHHLALPHPDQWNLPVLLEVDRPVRLDWLAEALTALVAHHDLLRLRADGQRRQTIVPVADCAPVPVTETDLTGLDPHQRAARIEAETRAVQAGLNLAAGPLLRAAVLRDRPDVRDRVVLVAHHLVVDTVSWQILLADLATGYRQLAAGEPVALPAKTTDFRRWAGRLAEYAGSPRVAREAGWWREELPRQVPALPMDGNPADPNREGDSELVAVVLDEPTTAALLTPARRAYRTRTDELLLAALLPALAGWTGSPRLLVDVEGHGRDALAELDVSRTVGWFTTFTPTWLDLSGVDLSDPGQLVRATKERLRAVPGRGAAHGLARWLRGGALPGGGAAGDDLAGALAALPAARVSFNYLGRLDPPAADLGGFTLAPEPVAAARHPDNPRPYLLDLVAGVRDGRLHLYLTYSPRHHRRSTIESLAAAWREAVRSVVAHCTAPGAGGPTPSDFPLATVDQAQVDRLVAAHGPLADLFPLSPLQQGLLFHTLANPHSGVYFEQFSILLEGPLDLAAFESAWQAALDRHAVLRGAVAWQGLAVPHLAVRERVPLPLTHHDWFTLDEPEQAARLAALLTEDRTTGFVLTEAPLTRLHLVRLARQQWRLVWSHHHLLLDGWSVALLIQEIFDSYEAIRAGQHRPAPPPPAYRDYLAYLSELDLAGAWPYWRRVLDGVTGPTPLAPDHPGGPAGRRDTDYARVGRRLPEDRSEQVRAFARTHRLTLDTVLFGAWALVLAHRSGADDVVFGVTYSGRPPALAGVEQMVGLFVNTLPARARISRDQPVAGWLAGLLREQVQARQYEHTPLDQVKGWTAVPPDRPLFGSLQGLENYPMTGSRFRTGSVAIREIDTFEQTNYPLSFLAIPDDELWLQLWYDARQFTPETAGAVLAMAEELALALVRDPDRTVGEVAAQVAQRHPTPMAGPADAPLPELVAGQVAQAEQALRALPAVREAVVVPAPDGSWLAGFLAPDPAALDRDQRAEPLAEQHVRDWQALYDQTYAEHPPADPTFHIVGWRSSYTGAPIPDEAMVEWRDRAVARVRALRPARILEIGCGTGLLLFGLLDGCQEYLGTDFSPVCLAQLREHLATADAATRAKVTLLERTADDLTGIPPGSFDVVVLNSVVQYFPGQSYLDRVLAAAVRAAAPGGAVFVGDVRHHGLHQAFAVSVELHRAVDLLPVEELAARVGRAVAHERELLVDPAYFTALAARRPEVVSVALLPRRGRHDTELTRYRYDAVLRLGSPQPATPPGTVRWYDWHRDVLSRSEIGWLLDQAGGDAVGVTGVPNARVAADVAAARLLARPDAPATAGQLRLAAEKAPTGMDPEELYQLAEQRSWTATVAWAAGSTDGSLCVWFQRGDHPPLLQSPPEPEPAGARQLTNPPLRAALAGELERQAWQALPPGVPVRQLRVVDTLPRTPDGRLDLAALPPVDVDTAAATPAATGTVPARTADELRLARVWERALGVTGVDVRTSFFDLGGDSLLAIRVIDEVSRVLGREVPMALLLQEPTIEGMVAALRAGPAAAWSPLVEVTGGDGTPLFCVHPAGGGVLCYAELARRLAPQPFYALQARGLDGDQPPYPDLPAMATRYLQAVRDRQPHGPYLLGGYSLGGLVAYEMAQQLTAAGERVGLLALVDTPTPDRIEDLPDEAAVLARLLAGRVELDPDALRELPPQQRLPHVLAAAERARVVPPGLDPDWAQGLFEVYTTHLAAARRYAPRPFGGPTCLFHTGEAAPAWDGLLTGRYEAVAVPGDHESVIWPPQVQALADALRTRLAAAAG